MGLQINVAGVWKSPDPKINVAGTWKTPDSVKINVAGVWKEVWTSGPTVSPRADGDVNYRFDATCYVGCYFYSNGNEYELTSSGGLTATTTWLDSGAGSDVWVEFVRTGGSKSTWVGYSNSTRYQISSNRNFYITAPAISINYQWIRGYFRMHDAASGGNVLWTGSTVTWSAEAEAAGGGGCPLCCFPAGTQVTLASGLSVNIEDVREGDNLLCIDADTGESQPQPVGEVLVREDLPLYKLTFSDGRTIRTTSDHPFHTRRGPAALRDSGWYKTYYEVAKLEEGDEVATERGDYVRLVKIERTAKEQYVYTFSNSLFFANGLLVY